MSDIILRFRKDRKILKGQKGISPLYFVGALSNRPVEVVVTPNKNYVGYMTSENSPVYKDNDQRINDSQNKNDNSSSFDNYFYNTSDFDALFGLSRIKGVSKALQRNPYVLQNWVPELAIRNTMFDTYNNASNIFGLPKVLYNTSFNNAYKNSRKDGQKSFIWNYNLYNTDYSGTHHKLYEKDLKSGKVNKWYSLYPNYTYPELRMAKLEELDTYGITNEQTKNKNLIDNLLVKIPARGYDVDEALRAILGEYSGNKEYINAKELLKAIYKTYPFLKDAPITFKEPDNTENPYYYNKPYIEYDINELREFLKEKGIEFTYDLGYVLSEARRETSGGSYGKELHRNEYNLLLGFPMNKNKDYPIPSISYYRTGSSPYYFTNNWLENSIPVLPSNISEKILNLNENEVKQKEYYGQLSKLLETKAKQLSKLSNDDWNNIDYKEYVRYIELAKQKYPYLNKREVDLENKDNFINNTFYSTQGELKEYWKQKGLGSGEGIPIISDMNKLLSTASKKELDTLIKYGILNSHYSLNVDKFSPGNYVATLDNKSSTKYYNQNYNENSKYKNIILGSLDFLRKYNIISNKDYNEYDAQIEDRNLINSSSLGRYTIGIPKDKNFISIYDIFDIDPFGSGNDKSKFTVGKPFEYYTRFYRNGAPNIDNLYRNFNINYK